MIDELKGVRGVRQRQKKGVGQMRNDVTISRSESQCLLLDEEFVLFDLFNMTKRSSECLGQKQAPNDMPNVQRAQSH